MTSLMKKEKDRSEPDQRKGEKGSRKEQQLGQRPGTLGTFEELKEILSLETKSEIGER